MFSKEDLSQIEKHGLTRERVERQIENFRNGFPYLPIVRAAAAGDGIKVLAEDDIARAEARYDDEARRLRVVKFVPASGAATRMFKELFEFINDDRRGKGIDTLLANIEKFAFWPEFSHHVNAESTDKEIVEAIIKCGLCYGSKPKGLVTFHAYPDGGRKAVEAMFSPEFRNRLDALVPFNALTPDLMGMIVDKCIAEMGKGLADKKVNLTLTPEARSWLAKEGYDAKLGARPLQRLLREALEDPLAGEVLFGRLVKGGTVIVDEPEDGGDKLVLRFEEK